MEGSPSIADQLSRLAQLENDFQRALEVEKLEAMAEFAAGAGHEINNPLTVISGRAQLLLRDETDPERRHALALISAQAMRVYEMIADMMLFARPPKPEFQPVELVVLLDQLVAGVKTGLGPVCRHGPESASDKMAPSPFLPQEIAILRTGDAGPIHIEADPTQLVVAFRAILQNSIEALSTGGQIEVDIKGSGVIVLSGKNESGEIHDKRLPTPLYVEVCIRDDGPGIKPEERRHLFDPYYSARQAGRGLGLGLSKAWRIITNHHGRIDVESTPGHGAAFRIVLPRKRPVSDPLF